MADILDGGDGSDTLDGGRGNDTLDGGAGNDRLYGGLGDDTYLFRRGSGKDVILHSSGTDTIQFGDGVTRDSLQFSGEGDKIIIRIKDTGDTITFNSLFDLAERFLFSDGTILSGASVKEEAATITGSEGGDVLYAFPSYGLNRLDGKEGNDLLFGSSLPDLMLGGEDDDLLYGGPGNDSIGGGPGNDIYIVEQDSGFDTIEDALGVNIIRFSEGISSSDVAVGRFDSDLYIWNKDNGVSLQGWSDCTTAWRVEFSDGVYWDVPTIIEKLSGISEGEDYLEGTSANDSIDGLGGSDEIYGCEGDDLLYGGAGDDYLDGGLGSDTFFGGPGDDWYLLDDSGDIVTEHMDEGHDIIESLVSVVMVDHVEDLHLEGEDAIDGKGNALSNVLNGNTSANLLTGEGGDDTLYGGGGDDTLLGGYGNDQLYASRGNATLDGGPGNDYLQGGSGNDIFLFSPGSGDDRIENSSDSDQNGIDTIRFGGGLDLGCLDFSPDSSGNADDLLISVKSTGETLRLVAFFSGESYRNKEFAFSDGTVFTAFQVAEAANRFTGTESPDLIHSLNSYATRVYGLEGNDTLIGGDENDTIDGGDGDDILITGLGASNILFGGPGDDRLYTDSWGGGILRGGAGNDSIYGGVVTDTLEGGEGNDYLKGGYGNDTYLFDRGFGNDTVEAYTGGSPEDGGLDTVLFEEGITPESVDFFSDGPGQGKSLFIEVRDTGDILKLNRFFDGPAFQVAAFVFADGTVLTAGEAAELGSVVRSVGAEGSIIGTSLADRLFGGLADNTVDADAGNDTVYGGGGNDVLMGSAGNDALHGDYGNDTIDGSSGDDYLRGGSGDDTYLFCLGGGNDTIHSFEAGVGLDKGQDTIVFGDGITPDSLDFFSDGPVDIPGLPGGNSLFIQIRSTGETLKLEGFFNGPDYVVDSFRFADGTFLNTWDVARMGCIVKGTEGNDKLAALGNQEGLYGGKSRISGLAGNDTLRGSSGEETIDGGDGDDLIDGGLWGNDLLMGGTGNDILLGHQEDDTLDGGAGDDMLCGGPGCDTYLFGKGAGNDIIETSSEDDVMLTVDPDTVQFGEGLTVDSLVFSSSGHTYENFVGGGEDLFIRIKETGDTLTIPGFMHGGTIDTFSFADGSILTAEEVLRLAGTIYGSSAGDTVEGLSMQASRILGLDGDDTLTGSSVYGALFDDTIDGGAGNDVLRGFYGNDLLLGGDGGDTLDGSTGDDTLSGGWGNDLLMGSYGNDAIDGGQGSDLLRGGVGKDMLFGSAGDDILWGQEGDDTIDGGEGDDVLRGGLGNDLYLFGQASGNDTIQGNEDFYGPDNGFDTIVFGQGMTLESLTFSGTSLEHGNGLTIALTESGDTLFIDRFFDGETYQVENFIFGDGSTLTADEAALLGSVIYSIEGNEAMSVAGCYPRRVYGMDGNDSITGSSRDDLLDGGTGSDFLDGSDGCDTMAGGDGDDTYVVGNLGDVVVEPFAEGIDTVQSSVSCTLGIGVERLLLTGAEAVNGSGNSLINRLIGNGASNILDGGPGADTMAGGAGDDTYIVDNPGDFVTEEAGGGLDTVLASVTCGLNPDVENLILTGSENINAMGNNLGNILAGNSGNNTLIGMSGDDAYLFAGGGGCDRVIDRGDDLSTNDRILFGEDVLADAIALFRSGDDLLIGYGASDTIDVVNHFTPASGIEEIELSDGRFLTNSDINTIIGQMASFAAGNGIAMTSLDDVRRNQDLMTIVASGWQP